MFKCLCRVMHGMLYSSVHLHESVFRLLFIKGWERNVAANFPRSVSWYVVQHLRNKLTSGLTESVLRHLFSQFPPFRTVLQQASWNWLFFSCSTRYSLYPEREPVSMHLTAEATHYFCLPHLPHPLFSSELRSHLSMLWVPARKNWCTECHVLPV